MLLRLCWAYKASVRDRCANAVAIVQDEIASTVEIYHHESRRGVRYDLTAGDEIGALENLRKERGRSPRGPRWTLPWNRLVATEESTKPAGGYQRRSGAGRENFEDSGTYMPCGVCGLAVHSCSMIGASQGSGQYATVFNCGHVSHPHCYATYSRSLTTWPAVVVARASADTLGAGVSVLTEIFSFLSHQTVCRSRLVSRRWNDAACILLGHGAIEVKGLAQAAEGRSAEVVRRIVSLGAAAVRCPTCTKTKVGGGAPTTTLEEDEGLDVPKRVSLKGRQKRVASVVRPPPTLAGGPLRLAVFDPVGAPVSRSRYRESLWEAGSGGVLAVFR